MAQAAPGTAPGNGAEAQPNVNPTTGKPRRKRSPSAARPAFFVLQVLGDDGQPMPFDKKRIKIITVERNAEAVLEITEGNAHPNAFYLRGLVPAGRGGPPSKAA